MKTAEEIRQHREHLREALISPCNCDKTGHAFSCRMGARLMAAQIDLLSWVLDESHDYERVVERMAR